MPRKKKDTPAPRRGGAHGHIENGGVVIQQPIVSTLRENYMPYAMSVIVSRAIPEIDGFKPSHRKILYTMYTMGLLNGDKRKSADIVGQTMALNPHGDQAIYETMVRLARGNGALLVPYVDSKGNFGKAYSRDMSAAASRYTEAKLEKICRELFGEIDKDTVDFVDNYNGQMKEPVLLPVTFPSILTNANTGIAVGMASNICSFNLAEVCETAVARLRDPDAPIAETLKAPDFPGGGFVLYDRGELEKIYTTGRGSVRVRSRYAYDKQSHCLDITEIPPTTTVEAIMDKTVELVKSGKIREISDIRDETDLSGLKLTIDLKRGVDPDKLMQKLYRMTPLEDSFSCNFNVLIGGSPRVLGVDGLLAEWTAFRRECVRRGIFYDLGKKKEKLHLLKGLQKILLDIDKAVSIVRETQEEKEVVPNLMIGFGISQVQAEYVAEIRLRHLNREYILNRTKEIESLQQEIAGMEETLNSPKKVDALIISQLREIAKTFGQPRRSQILYDLPDDSGEEPEDIPTYPVHLFFTREGYFKKITPQSLRMSGEQKLKEGDEILQTVETTTGAHLLFFTNRGQVYKSRAAEFDDTKASVLGDYLPTKLGMDPGELPVYMAVTMDYRGYMLFAYENGKIAKVELSSYATKTNRKKLLGAYSVKSPLIYIEAIPEDIELLCATTASRMLIVNTAMVAPKATRDTQGIQALTMKSTARLLWVQPYQEGQVENPHRLRTKALPAAGALVKTGVDLGEQLTL
ncbi:MAG: topoisomerase IV [Angelakisella sp.]|jgi:DNA gyrase subunit A|nr:topoisomerase IV [Angelakisella sp.]